MIEAYAFLAAFTVQIVAMSVLYPIWFLRRARVQVRSVLTERFAPLHPGVDPSLSVERFATRYRALNTGIAVLGLALLGWLFNYLQRADWDDGPVETLVCLYFGLQVLPFCIVVWFGVTLNKVLRPLMLEGKRKATLRRRGLFDFVSPFVVSLAVLAYFLFAAFVIYLREQPFPGFAGFINIGGITLVYALNAFVVYMTLYERRMHLFETRADRLHTIGLTVRSSVYSCIVVVVFVSLNFTLVLLDLQSWEPFALSVFFVATTFLCFIGLTAPPRQPGADGLGSDESQVSVT